MPAYSADDSPRKALLLGAAVGVVGLLLFWFTRHREDSVQILLRDNLESQAKEVLVLVDEARSVCMDLAGATLEERRRAKRQSDDDAIDGAAPAGADEDRAFARGILDLAAVKYRTAKRTSLRLGPALGRDTIAGDLENLQSLARSLCFEVGRRASPNRYESNVTTKLRGYTAYRAGIEPRYLADELEREQILARLEPMIEGHRQQAIALHEVDGESRAWVPEEDGGRLERLSPEQVRTERRELRAEEEWRQRQAERRESLHREAIGQGRAEGQPVQRALPRVGLEQVDRDSFTGIAIEARSWSKVYREETGAVTVALRRFDMIRRIAADERTLRACRALFSKVTDLLQSDRLFSSPLEALNELLERGYKEAQGSAEACLAGDLEEANRRFDRAEALFSKIEAEYGLSPD